MSEHKKKVLIELDFNTNEAIKTEIGFKRIKGETEMTAQDAIAVMVEERFVLSKILNKKGMTFDELLNFLNKKNHVKA